MAQQWFYKLADGRDIGPVSSAELKRLADSGQIDPTTPVKQATGERWVAASRITGLFKAAPSNADRVEPPPLPPIERAVVPPAPVASSAEDDDRRLAGISTKRWMAASVVGTIAIVWATLVIYFVNRGENAPPKGTVVAERPVTEPSKPSSDKLRDTPKMTIAKNDQPSSEKPVEKLASAASTNPTVKNTEKTLPAIEPAAVVTPPIDDRVAAAEEKKKEAAEQAQAVEEARKAEEAKQAELNSLTERIAAAKADFKQIEQEAIVVAAKRSDAFTQAIAAESVAGKAAAQIANLQTRIDQLTADLNGRSSSEASRRDQLTRRGLALAQQAALREQYGTLEAKYKELDTGARDLKSQLDSLVAKKAARSLELRRMEIQYDLLLRGPSPGAIKDVATASAWRGVKKGMKTAEVEALLGKPSKTESQARNADFASSAGHGGIVWQYKYQEAGTTIGIVGTIHFVTGKVIDWEAPPWAVQN
jgi:hypothetical protein